MSDDEKRDRIAKYLVQGGRRLDQVAATEGVDSPKYDELLNLWSRIIRNDTALAAF